MRLVRPVDQAKRVSTFLYNARLTSHARPTPGFDKADSIDQPIRGRAIAAGNYRSWPGPRRDPLCPATAPAKSRPVSIAGALASIAAGRKSFRRLLDISQQNRTQGKWSREKEIRKQMFNASGESNQARSPFAFSVA